MKTSPDKNWLLNAAAIRIARQCIILVREELGVKLTLSHPDFMDLLRQYAELTDNTDLLTAFNVLSELASLPKIVLTEITTPELIELSQSVTQKNSTLLNNEMVTYKGRQYPKYSADGVEFKGLYRGQPNYG